MNDPQRHGRLADQLRRAYRATHDEETALSAVDDHLAVILQYLRIGITPAVHLSAQFEAHLQLTSTNLVTESSTFTAELRRLRRHRLRRRVQLYDQLMAAEGNVWRDGDWHPDPDGYGDIEAFVYDDRTGQYLIRSGIGTHHLAVYALYDQLRPAELGKRWPLPPVERTRDMLERMQGYVAGFIVRLPEWQTPFLHLWAKEPGLSAERWYANARRVQRLRSFLVVLPNGAAIPTR